MNALIYAGVAIVVAILVGPVAVLAWQLISPRGKHRRRGIIGDAAATGRHEEEGRTMTTTEPDDGGPEIVTPPPEPVPAGEPDHSGDDDTDAGHAEDGSDTQADDDRRER